MADYTEDRRKMFEPRIYDILKKAEVSISTITLEYLMTLSPEDLEKLSQLAFFYGSDEYFETMGKAKIQFETQRIKRIAESWKLQTITQLRAKPPSISNILDEELKKIDVSKIQTNHNQPSSSEIQQEISTDIQIQEEDELAQYSHLNPVRHREGEFFIADIFNSPVVRDDIASMEFPIFALKPGDTKIINFEFNNIKTTIKPSVEIGRATIFDKDIWIYAISKLMQAKYEGKEINQVIRFAVRDYLLITNRHTGGSQYQQFKDSLERLVGTRITTEIETGGLREAKGFGLIDSWAVIEKDNQERAIAVEIKLPDWLYRVVLNDEVKAISPDYFRLRKPIDRRIYEIVAKHIGRKNEWQIGLKKLYEKSGSKAGILEFRRNINSLINTNELPDYFIAYDRPTDIVSFTRRTEVDERALEAKKHNADLQKKRLSSRKKIIISDDFRQKLSSTVKYCPQFSSSGLLTDEFLKKCLKQYSEEQILKSLETCKSINFDSIKNPKAYFLKVLQDGK